MSEIHACFTAAGVPLVAPTDVPTIRITRMDTQTLVITDSAMTEQGQGCFSFTFAPVATLEYSIRADGDPLVNGQLSAAERFAFGALSGITVNEIETNIPALLTGQGTINTNIAGNLTAINNNGTAIGNNLTAINANATAIATNLTAIMANLTAIGLLNNISIADVQTAMDNQNFTAARGLLLDNLDATISSIATLLAPLATMDTRLLLALKVLINRLVTDPVAGTITILDDDDSTPLLSAPLWQDAAGTIPYQGLGAERRDRLT